MKNRKFLAMLVAGCPLLLSQNTPAATLFLKTGTFYGPGATGVHSLENAQVRNIQLGPNFQGVVPFFNNGATAPNVIAEILQGGVVDGYTSDGRAINENIDTALHLLLEDAASGESANIMVVSVQQETVKVDPKGNLVFEANVVADPGQPSLVQPFQVRFTSGAAKVPVSLRTRNNTYGGHDFAGPLQSGHVLIGRIGDFDHDGLLDGELVQGENAPLDLVVARGDPLAQLRPWVSDIPSTPALSAMLNLNGIVQNFPEPVVEALGSGRIQAAIDYGFDINARLNAALYDLGAILQSQSATRSEKWRTYATRLYVRSARSQIEHGLDLLQESNGRHDRLQRAGASLQRGLKTLSFALLQFAPDRSQSPRSSATPNRSESDAGMYASELIQQAFGRD